MTRYRYVTPVRKGRWLPSMALAKLAAVRAKVAHEDDQGRVFLDALTDIEVERLTHPANDRRT